MQTTNDIYNDNVLDELKLTLFVYPKAVDNFPIDRRARYSLLYSNMIYKIRDNILDYSAYLSYYFEANPNAKELILEFKYATSPQALNVVMKLLCGFKEVHIPNEEYIQVLAFIEELSN